MEKYQLTIKRHFFGLLAIGYAVYTTFKYLNWHYKGFQVRATARAALNSRNSTKTDFDCKGIDVEK